MPTNEPEKLKVPTPTVESADSTQDVIQGILERAKENEEMRLAREQFKQETTANIDDISAKKHEAQRGETLCAIVLSYQKAYMTAKGIDLGLNFATTVKRFDKNGNKVFEGMILQSNNVSRGDIVTFERNSFGILTVVLREAGAVVVEKKPVDKVKDDVNDKGQSKVEKSNVDLVNLLDSPEFTSDEFFKKYGIKDRADFARTLQEMKGFWPNRAEFNDLNSPNIWKVDPSKMMPAQRETELQNMFEFKDGKMWYLWEGVKRFAFHYPNLFNDVENENMNKMKETFMIATKRLIEYQDEFVPNSPIKSQAQVAYHESIVEHFDRRDIGQKISKDVLPQLIASAKFLKEEVVSDKAKYEKLYREYTSM